MSYEVANQKPTMSKILASNGVKELCTSLSLTEAQINNAKSRALQLSGDEKLSKCDPFSLVKFCFESARYNFSRDDCIYPVPYGNKVQAQMGYKGIRELCLASGCYKEVNCKAVYNCDKVYRDEDTGNIKVKFETDINKTIGAEVIGYYAYAIEKGEEKPSNTLYWTLDQCLKHGKHYSKTFASVWGDELNQEKMCKKTVLKQLCGELRTTPLLQEAIKQDQVVYGKENEKDSYLDNPLSDIEEHNGVNNSIIDNEEEQDTRIVNDLTDDELRELDEAQKRAEKQYFGE